MALTKVTGAILGNRIIREYDTVAEMQADSTLEVGQVVQLKDRANAQFDVIAATTNNGYDILDGTASSVSVQLKKQYPVDVRAYGVTDDLVDSSAAMQRVIDSLGSTSTSWAVTAAGVSGNAHKVVLPYPENGGYRFNTTIDIPSTLAVDIESGGTWGSVIQSTQDYVFNIKGSPSGVFRGVSVRGFAFAGTGVSIEANVRGNTRITDNVFGDTPDYAIKGLGISIVRGEIKRNKFSACAGCVSFDYIDCDMWVIAENDLTRSTEVDILLNTTGVSIYDNDFETRATAGATKPWIKSKIGDVRIEDNRFGDESITGYAPPRDAIQIGLDTPTSTIVGDVIIARNTFKGTNGTVSSTEADSCVRLNAPVARLKFDNNYFTENSDYNSYVINENYISALGNDARSSNNNRAFGNEVPSTFTVPFFSNGGVSFDSDVFKQKRRGPVGNLLRYTNDLTNANWIKTNSSVVKDATGPDGVANSAFTITKPSSGSSNIRTQMIGTANNVDGVINVKAVLKKGTLDRARIYIVNTTNNYTQQSNTTLVLGDEWEEYSVDFPNIDTSKTYFAYIAVGADNATDSALTGTILVAEPMASHGRGNPGFYLPNIHTGGTVHADLSHRGYMLGDNTVDFGTALPSSGRYEIGDIIYKTDSVADGNNMILDRWRRVTGGTGHVSGTDWEPIYVSTVSPAT